MEITLEHVSKHFKDKKAAKKAVDDISLKLGPGVWGLLGANGSGKTTLMRMICGIMKPTAGRIYYDGIEIDRLGDAYRDVIGYLPQEFGFYPEFTVQQYLEYISALKGLTDRQARARIDELLVRLSLEDVRRKRISKLSGGMKRRVGIGQALLNDPEFLVLDEPTSGLDPGERVRFRNIISSLSKNRLILLSTHIVSDLESIADQILLMHNGRLVQMGDEAALLEKAAGCVWKCLVSEDAAAALERQYTISNLRHQGSAVELRIISEKKPAKEAQQIEATLEDAYLYLSQKAPIQKS